MLRYLMKFTRRRAVPTLATLSALALALSACGGASDASSNAGAGGEGVQYASDKIAAASKNPEFTFAGPAFKMSDIAGKTIFNIPNNSSIPYIEAVDMEAKKVAESYGATWVEYSTQGLPNEHTAGIDQAINQDADIIILAQGINAELIVPALERAKAAGIPVLITHTYQNGSSLPATLDGLIAGSITAPFNEAARLMADYAIKETESGNILIVNSSEVPPSNGMVAAMKDELATHCGTCKVEEVDVSATAWATDLSSTVQSALQTNPNIDFVLPVYDSMMLYVESAVLSSGKVGQVETASFNGTPAILKLMQEGDVVAMDVGEDVSWLAWSTLDEAGRILTGTGATPGGDQKTPLKVITDENVAETGTPPESGKGYGNAYITGYEALWGKP
jgi:ribose transport system substrate-binding protein